MVATQAHLPAEKSTNVRPPVPWALRGLRAAFALGGRVSPRWASVAAERLFFRPTRHASPAREAAWFDASTFATLTVAGQPIATYSWGQGPVVLLVHGWAGRGLQMGGLAQYLAARGFRALSFDAPAHGRSPGQHTDLPTVTRVVRALGEHVGPLAGVVGHSMGAAATTLALGDGLVARSAVLISSPARLTRMVSSFAAQVSLPPRATEHFRRRLERRFGGDAVWDAYSPAHRAQTLATPALVVHDLADGEVPHSEGALLCAAWPNAQLLSTRGLGHSRILRNPYVHERIAQFVRDAAERKTP